MKNKKSDKDRTNKILTDRIKAFDTRLEYMNKNSMLVEVKKEINFLLGMYKPTTVRGYLTIYKRQTTIANKDVINALKLNKKQQNSIEKPQRSRTFKKQNSRTKVKNIDTMLQTAVLLLDSDKYPEVVIALCLLTGRRISEIIKTAKFKNSKNSKKVMYFEGQLKTDDKRKYEIPVLMNSKNECKIALKKLRSMEKMANVGKMSVFEVGRAYNTQVNQAANSWFSAHIGKCSSHDMRKVYAAYCDTFINNREEATNTYLSKIMGHSEEDNTTSNTYQKYKF